MDEGHPGVADPHAGRLVDELQAPLAQRGERGVDVGHAVGDVVQPRAAAGQEAAHGRVRREWPQELDVPVADLEQHGLDALLVDDLAVLERQPVGLLVQRDRRVEVGDGDADVIDPLEHGRESSAPRVVRTAF